jgi:hypothetical protein
MNFFQYQETIPYAFGATSDTMVQTTITNITQRARIAERLRQHTTIMHEYVIGEGERPDMVAQNVYGDVKYTWVVLLMNNIVSLYDWPMMNSEFELYLIGKYGSLSLSQNQGTRTDAAWSAAKFYYTTEGDRVDATTYAGLGARQGTTNTPYTQEVEDNDAKRRIKVVPASVLAGLGNALKTLYRT